MARIRVSTINSKDYYKKNTRIVEDLVTRFKVEAQKLLDKLAFNEEIAPSVCEEFRYEIDSYSLNFPEIKSGLWRSVSEMELECDKFYDFSEKIIDNLTDFVGVNSDDPESKTSVLSCLSNEILIRLDDISEYVDMAVGNLFDNGKDEDIYIIE